MSRIEKILVTTDFSETSYRAFDYARELGEKFGAKLILTHVEEDHLPPLVLEYTNVDLSEILERQRVQARERLTEIAPRLGDNVEIELAAGTPHREIVRVATEREADLIVIGTHGRGFVANALLGSTAERVLRHAPCPVLIVREPAAS